MYAQLVSTENEEGGLVVLLMSGEQVTAMDCLGYGSSDQRNPEVGENFVPKFTCLFDDEESWSDIFEGNKEEAVRLTRTGTWSYRVFGKVVEGQDVVDAIKSVKTGNAGFHQDVPKEDVIIEKAEVC